MTEKDKFLELYKDGYVKRVLRRKLLIDDTENTLITKLKIEFGIDRMNFIGKMNEDVLVSNDMK